MDQGQPALAQGPQNACVSDIDTWLWARVRRLRREFRTSTAPAIASEDVDWHRSLDNPANVDVPVALFEGQPVEEQARLIDKRRGGPDLHPGFDVLNVFAVPQRHAVTMVAPFAGAPRYSITGWWQDRGPESWG